jgi:hypothetical protein
LDPLRSRLIWIAGIVASVAVVVAVFAAPYFATHDGPQHIYLEHVSTHFADPGAPYADFYRPTTALSARGFSLLYGPLSEFFAWKTALRLTLSIILLTWSWGVMVLVHVVKPERLVLGLLGFASAFQWTLFMGFFSYLFSIAVGLFIVALAIKRSEWSRRARLFLAGLLLVQAVIHLFGAQIVGLFLLVLVTLRSKKSELPRELGLLALMGLPVFLIALYAAGWIGGGVPRSSGAEHESFRFLERLWLAPGLFLAGPAWRRLPIFLFVAAGLCSLWLRRQSAPPAERALGLVAIVLLSVGLTAPIHLPQWEYFSPRFLAPAAAFALPLVPLESYSKKRFLLAGAVVAGYTLGSIAWAGSYSREVYRRCGDAFAGMDQPIQRKGLRLPVLLESSCGQLEAPHVAAVPFFEPAANLGQLYAVAQGGIVPYTFALAPQLHGFVLREDVKRLLPPVPKRSLYYSVYENPVTRFPPEKRFAFTTMLASNGRPFEDVILHGHPAERQVFLDRGYVSDWSQGHLGILRFSGCSVVLPIEMESPPTRAVRVHYAWHPDESFGALPPIVPDTFAGKSAIESRLSPLACGPVRIRVFIDDDDSGDWSSADRRCRGAAADGSVRLTISDGARLALCSLVRP